MTNKMTPKVALEQIEQMCEYECMRDNSKCDTRLVNIAKEALKKQVPKKPKRIGELDIDSNAEVECDCFGTQDVAIKTIKRVHCWKCGQLLEWGDDDDR